MPKPDPRLSEKNFGMPMPPGGTTSPEWPETRRKDGDERPKREPVTHGIPDPPPVVESKQRPQSGYEHPFKIVTGTVGDEIRLYLCHGAFSCWGFDSETFPQVIELPPVFTGAGAGNLLRDPFDTEAAGYSVLSPDTEYGVWIVTAYASGTPLSNPAGDADIPTIRQWTAIGTSPRVEVSASQTNRLLKWVPAAGDEIGYFIGKVSVAADGSVAVKQWRKSDLIVPMVALPASINFPAPP